MNIDSPLLGTRYSAMAFGLFLITEDKNLIKDLLKDDYYKFYFLVIYRLPFEQEQRRKFVS